MKAIKRTVTIEDPRQLTLFNLPFSPIQETRHRYCRLTAGSDESR